MAGLSEFELIKRYFEPISNASRNTDRCEVLLGIGDDCGMVSLPPGKTLCFSIDTLVEGVHFPCKAPPFQLAYRALAVAMSDLAAMGAHPFFFTLALTLPDTHAEWLKLFSEGLKTLADQYEMPLLGGDTTKGPLTISIQVHGLLGDKVLKRSSAQAGDILAVSGTLGDAGAALDFLADDIETLSDDALFLLDRYYQPTPRITLGEQILPFANACIDISDGLLAEAYHISECSSVKLEIESAKVPLSSALIRMKGGVRPAITTALAAGDDYELLFTVPEHKWQQCLASLPSGLVRQIGRVGQGTGVYLDGKEISNIKKGYQHFD